MSIPANHPAPQAPAAQDCSGHGQPAPLMLAALSMYAAATAASGASCAVEPAPPGGRIVTHPSLGGPRRGRLTQR
jgi:hypothetical protein